MNFYNLTTNIQSVASSPLSFMMNSIRKYFPEITKDAFLLNYYQEYVKQIIWFTKNPEYFFLILKFVIHAVLAVEIASAVIFLKLQVLGSSPNFAICFWLAN